MSPTCGALTLSGWCFSVALLHNSIVTDGVCLHRDLLCDETCVELLIATESNHIDRGAHYRNVSKRFYVLMPNILCRDDVRNYLLSLMRPEAPDLSLMAASNAEQIPTISNRDDSPDECETFLFFLFLFNIYAATTTDADWTLVCLSVQFSELFSWNENATHQVQNK